MTGRPKRKFMYGSPSIWKADTDIVQPNLYHTHKEMGYFNALHARSHWRVKWPNTFQFPGIRFPGDMSRHRDIMQRANNFDANDYYLSPVSTITSTLY